MNKKYIATDISRLCKKGYISARISSIRDKRYYLDALHAPMVGDAYVECKLYQGQVYVGKIMYYNDNKEPDYIYFNDAGFGAKLSRNYFFRKV